MKQAYATNRKGRPTRTFMSLKMFATSKEPLAVTTLMGFVGHCASPARALSMMTH